MNDALKVFRWNHHQIDFNELNRKEPLNNDEMRRSGASTERGVLKRTVSEERSEDRADRVFQRFLCHVVPRREIPHAEGRFIAELFRRDVQFVKRAKQRQNRAIPALRNVFDDFRTKCEQGLRIIF